MIKHLWVAKEGHESFELIGTLVFNKTVISRVEWVNGVNFKIQFVSVDSVFQSEVFFILKYFWLEFKNWKLLKII